MCRAAMAKGPAKQAGLPNGIVITTTAHTLLLKTLKHRFYFATVSGYGSTKLMGCRAMWELAGLPGYQGFLSSSQLLLFHTNANQTVPNPYNFICSAYQNAYNDLLHASRVEFNFWSQV